MSRTGTTQDAENLLYVYESHGNVSTCMIVHEARDTGTESGACTNARWANKRLNSIPIRLGVLQANSARLDFPIV